MQNYFDVNVTNLNYGFSSYIKPHCYHEWAQTAHRELADPAAPTEDVVWVYSAHRAQYLLPQSNPKHIRFITWISSFNGIFSTREFLATDIDSSQVLFRRTTTCVALDRTTLRPSKKDLSQLSSLVSGSKQEFKSISTIPSDNDSQFTLNRRIEPDDIDSNLHVNNTSYIRWGTDFINLKMYQNPPTQERKFWVEDMQIKYFKPLTLGMSTVISSCVNQCSLEGFTTIKLEVREENAEKCSAEVFFVTKI